MSSNLLQKQKDYTDLKLVVFRLVVEGDYLAAKQYLDRIINFDWST